MVLCHSGAFDIPDQAIIDREVVVVHEGRTNFSELQADLAIGDQDRLLYYAFDLLWLDGKDLRKMPQIERKRLLKELFDKHALEPPVLFSEPIQGDGQQLFAHAAKLDYEGVISKRANAPYRSERSEVWLKVKAVQRFPVIGFIKDPAGVAALYLGKREGRELVYMGKVGTGWSRTVSSKIRKQLDAWSVRSQNSPSRSENRRPRGSNLNSPPTSNIRMSRPTVCYAPVPLKACSKNNQACLGRLPWVFLFRRIHARER
jgi:bifunctional non-homologous end joining protein LigD